MQNVCICIVVLTEPTLSPLHHLLFSYHLSFSTPTLSPSPSLHTVFPHDNFSSLSLSSPSPFPSSSLPSVTMLYAMYEYTAQYDEELSFPEGARIELLRTDDNGVDDGWWEGRYEGKVGVFPSVVVEVLSNDSVSVGCGCGDV